ncbi:MAG TPA: NAD/NADP octopine/nopaline dehydrogenase family protein [Rectinemataceae bacterium]|nr:NAD/NADP octopine/nopaline dehydrogenase family protein [Rectinemataceae bacterium]
MAADYDWRRACDTLKEVRAKGKKAVWCVVGAGNGGLSMAGHLGLMGFEVRLYNRTDEHLNAVRWYGGVELEGAVEGFGPIHLATSSIQAAVEGADVVMIVTPSTAHYSLASAMAPFLRDGQVVVLNPGRTGGALEFNAVLRRSESKARPVIVEAQTFIYASRAVNRHKGHIYRVKNGVPASALPSHMTPDALAVLNQAFPQFTAGSNVLATSLENIGAVFHPALTLLNAGWIESTEGNFEYYIQGMSPAVAKVLERIDDERLAVSRALGIRTVSAREWLYLTYDSPGDTLCAAIKATTGYFGIKAPATISHRYIWEDVPMSLVPMSSIGAMLGIPTPTIDMIITLAEIMNGCDYRAVGRTVESLGIGGMNVEQIHRLVTEGDR